MYMGASKKIKILIADDDRQLSRRLGDFLTECNFEVHKVEKGFEVLKEINTWKPRIVLIDLMLPEGNAYEILEKIRGESKSGRPSLVQIIVMSGHNIRSNVEKSLQMGASDYIIKPFLYEDVLHRLIFHLRKTRTIQELNPNKDKSVDEGTLLLHLTDLVLRTANAADPLPEKLFNLTRMAALKLDGVRCSVIKVHNHKDGEVVASHDSRDATGIKLDLNKYPEIIHVWQTGLLLAIENIDMSSELKAIRESLKSVNFSSLVVCPLYQNQKMYGALSLRLPSEKKRLSDNEIRFVEIIGHSLSLVLSAYNSNKKEDLESVAV
jgi:DNA-binding response OmpR family regulator